MATDNSQTTPSERAPLRDTGALMLAAGGLAAAFGAASCCGVPLLLGSLGLSSAWLVAVAWLAAPHRIALLIKPTAASPIGQAGRVRPNAASSWGRTPARRTQTGQLSSQRCEGGCSVRASKPVKTRTADAFFVDWPP